MKIHFFTKGDRTVASSRARIFLVSDALRKRGNDCVVYVVLPRAWWNFSFARIKDFINHVRVLIFAPKGTVLYLHKTIFQVDFLFLVFIAHYFFRRKIIVDFDDAQYIYAPYKIQFLISLATCVVVGSHALMDYVEEFDRRVELIPTVVDTDVYMPRLNTQKLTMVVGWVGSPAHYKNLCMIAEVFQELSNERIEFSALIIGAHRSKKIHDLFSIQGSNITVIDDVDWGDPCSVVRYIQQFDIGLMPLEDTEWNRGKCAFKAIEYMACGVPVIVSPVGEARHVVHDGVNGLYARNKEEWKTHIKNLLSDVSIRERIGEEARKTIKARYSYKYTIPQIEKLISSLP